MSDPFVEMYAPPIPVEPDPTFAARLRSRLERALELPKGVTVSNLQLAELTELKEPAVTSASIIPYLAVAGAEDALEWYSDAFGARLRGEPIAMPDGRIGHAEFDIGGATIMLSEQYPEIEVAAPVPGAGVAVTLLLDVVDVDAVIDRAVTAGARLERAAADYDYGRNGVIRDPFGHRWMISAAPATPAPAAPASAAPASAAPASAAHARKDQADPSGPDGLRHGDVGYVSLWLPDVERAAPFFQAVLGWRYGPASSHEGRQIEGQSLHHGMFGGEEHSTLFCCYAVEDVPAAILQVRAAGGTASEPHEEPYGLIAECVDDQGVRFAVFEPPGGVVREREPAPSRPGDLSYLTLEVVDSARTRAFYGSVLGWGFDPGRVADGWQIQGMEPPGGISGGHQVATTVPMYSVEDITAAVAAVRAGGGEATDPEVQPYGITSTCSDGHGTRFYLGQF
jgi:uncharacterized glyoxalase superfamily protein PhnB